MSKYALDLIDQYVETELKSPNVEHNVVCFRQCIKFWTLTEDLKDLDVNLLRERFAFKLLAFVDHENPLLRYSAKNWLMVSIRHFHNILDVVYIHLLQHTEWVVGLETTYAAEYPTDRVTECIKHLKNMLIVLGNSFFEFITTSRVEAKIIAHIPRLGEKKLMAAQGINYLDLLAVICLRYIEGTVKEEGTSFQIKNLSVKATACEFLELILSKHPNDQTILQISFYLLDPLSHVLRKAVEDDESSILIQILSVLSVILFNNKIQQDKVFREKYLVFVQKPEFISTLIKGLSSKHLYIVIEFKDFINSLVNVAAENLLHPALTTIVANFIDGYLKLISANNTRFVRTRKFDRLSVTKA